MSLFIDVILPIPLKRLFTYSISAEELNHLSKGMRVAVPFGKSKLYTAIVTSIHETPPSAYEAKSIYSILDQVPIVNYHQLKLWYWISEYYMCSVGEVMRAALPNGLLLNSETVVAKGQNDIDMSSLKDKEYLIYEALEYQSQLSIDEVSDILSRKQVLPLIQRMVAKGLVVIQEQLQVKYKPKLLRHVRLHPSYQSEFNLKALLELLSRSPKQREAVLTLFQLQGSRIPIQVKTLIGEANVSSSVVKTLIDKQVFEEVLIETSRLNNTEFPINEPTILNSEQASAMSAIIEGFQSKKTVLLHGVTSSGKTELYIQLIQNVLNKSKQALYLVPEIALTTQLVKRLEQCFGNQVLVFHSKYSSNERVEVWNTLIKSECKPKVVIGARSSVFLPWSNLDLIIIDEEHEVSYKQFDPAPRYHARDTAIVLGRYFKANVLLGSATPSLESYFNVNSEKFHLVELKKRFNNVLMPEIEVIDLADKYKRKRMTGHFSDRLIEEMRAALDQNFQVILFQNRRGFSPVMECLTCGHSPQCPNCDVSLTYHQYRNQLRCHYCGYNKPKMNNCEACGNPTLDTKGFGTEQIEEEVKALFPDKFVARMDLDTTRGKYSFERLIARFEAKEIDILVGTQMVTKGLDFRDVKLVGVLNADNLLNFPDFRAHERCFQLLSQVSGRSGRTNERGRVVIQSFNPHHNILQQVSTNDYQTMYKEQMEDRYQFHYPPLYRIIKITFRHRQFERVNMASEWFAKALRDVLKVGILGPEYPPVSRVRNQYHKNIMVKMSPNQSLSKTKEAIRKIENSFLSIKDFRAVRVVMNVDSY